MEISNILKRIIRRRLQN